ncbi:GNAT family N-acetyltransferase [Sphingobacterium suaedae]|uniref:GNAT family N-acetyltransferase n=1 Tax=Sphingobacterium suaedae TaxID=1686402 RepID=A0ABW5KJ18_9SPHI
MLEVKQQDGRKGKFEIFNEGALAGEMTYTWAGDTKFIIDHTEVKEGFEGKGYGKQLVMAAVEFARSKNVKIMPLCPYAKRVFDKDTAIRDVLF